MKKNQVTRQTPTAKLLDRAGQRCFRAHGKSPTKFEQAFVAMLGRYKRLGVIDKFALIYGVAEDDSRVFRGASVLYRMPGSDTYTQHMCCVKFAAAIPEVVGNVATEY